MKRRRKCPVCGLYLGAKPHSGAIHDRIMAARSRARRGLLGRFRRRRR
jgi:hypothetical protein